MTSLMMMIMMMRPPHCHVNHHSTLARPISHVPHTSLCAENRENSVYKSAWCWLVVIPIFFIVIIIIINIISILADYLGPGWWHPWRESDGGWSLSLKLSAFLTSDDTLWPLSILMMMVMMVMIMNHEPNPDISFHPPALSILMMVMLMIMMMMIMVTMKLKRNPDIK